MKSLIIICLFISFIIVAVRGNNSRYTTKCCINESELKIKKRNIQELNENLYLNDSIEFIGEFKKVYSKEKIDIECKEWIITKEQLLEVLPKMQKVDKGYEWYASCSIYPCNYETMAKIGNINNCKIIINAGGYVRIYINEKSFVYILKEHSNYFLSVCNPELYGK